jgi:hypothetical protein
MEVSGPCIRYAMTLCPYLTCWNLMQDVYIECIVVFNSRFSSMFCLIAISKYSFKFESRSYVSETLHIMFLFLQECNESSPYTYGASKK